MAEGIEDTVSEEFSAKQLAKLEEVYSSLNPRPQTDKEKIIFWQAKKGGYIPVFEPELDLRKAYELFYLEEEGLVD